MCHISCEAACEVRIRSKFPEKSGGGGLKSTVAPFEQRLLLFAVDDSASLTGSNTSVVIDVLGNDPGVFKKVDSVGVRTYNTNGGVVTFNPDGTLTYSVYAGSEVKALADYTTANNNAIAAITAWHTTEVGRITNHYSAVSATIDRFGEFLQLHSGGLGILGTAAGQATSAYFGLNPEAVGKVVAFLSCAYAANQNAGYRSIIADAQQIASDACGFEITVADDWQQILFDSLNRHISYYPSPNTYGNDSFTYTMSEIKLTPMASMPGMLVPTIVSSTATVNISANVQDYSAMVVNIDRWVSSSQGWLNNHKYPEINDLNKMYGETLMSYATSKGWEVVWELKHASFTDYHWNGAYSLWPGLDAGNIADELNAIGFR